MSSILYSKSLMFCRLINRLKYLGFYDQMVRNWRPFQTIKVNLNLISKSNKLFVNKCIECKESVKPNTLWSWDIVSGLLIWFGIIEDFESKENPLVLTVKRGIYCMQTEEYERADLILHSALAMAQDLQFESAETYIFDVMANNYMKKEDYKRAEQLFIEVFNRVLKKGMEVNDESIIEISIKLSKIYSISGDFDKCDKGFDFCLTEQNKRVKSFVDKSSDELNDEEINSMALLGMCLDYYAQHLSSVGQFDKALDHYERALDICLKINGKTHPQTLVLLNDMSATYVHKKDYENALKSMKKAIEGAIRTEDKNLANYYYNIGSIYLLQLNKDLALMTCRESLNLTLRAKDKFLEKKARECMTAADKQ